MTDKEIIIDGVDITECDHFSMGLPVFNDLCTLYPHQMRCEDNKNCYYKQLVRKEQECEKLRQANDEKNEFLKKLGISATGEFHRIKHYIDKLYQECEELKAEVCRCNHSWGETSLQLDWYKQAEQFKQEENYNLTMKLYEYKQALEKIEEILKFYANTNLGEITLDGRYLYFLGINQVNGEKQYLYYDPRKALEGLDTINEVKNEN